MVEYEVWLKSSETALHLLKQKSGSAIPLVPRSLVTLEKHQLNSASPSVIHAGSPALCSSPFTYFGEDEHVVGSQILWAGLVGSDDFVGANQKCVVFNGLWACLLSWWDTQLTLHLRSGHVHQILPSLSLYSILHNILQLNSGERIHSAKPCKCQSVLETSGSSPPSSSSINAVPYCNKCC